MHLVLTPFPRASNPYVRKRVYIREPRIFTTPREIFGILRKCSYIHRVNDDKNKVMENVENIKTMLSNYRLSIDDREEVTPGYKFNEWELKGVPIRIEIGPRDIENNKVILSRRDIDNSKEEVSIEKLKSTIDQLIIDIQNNMFDISKKHMEENTIHVDTKEDLIEALNNKEGFVTCYWSENKDDELEIKELTSATIRCYPINNEETKQSINDKKDGKFAIFSKAY